jgi:hypothetical protein
MFPAQLHQPFLRRALAIVLCAGATGCEALSPQQLWKLNRQPNLERGDAYFSIPAETDSDFDQADVITHLEAPPARK